MSNRSDEFCHAYIYMYQYMYEHICMRHGAWYGVARNLKSIGLFCKRALSNRRYSAKETYDFKEPTNRSHPIGRARVIHMKRCIQFPINWFSKLNHGYISNKVSRGERRVVHESYIWKIIWKDLYNIVASHERLITCCNILIERNPPPRGGFLFSMFPDQEPCARGPPWKNKVQILRGGSSYTRFLIMEHSK